MAEDTFLEGLDEKQLKNYSEYLKLPNITKEIAKSLALEEIDSEKATEMMFGSGLEITEKVEKGEAVQADSLAIIQGISTDSVAEGLNLTSEIFKKNNLLKEFYEKHPLPSMPKRKDYGIEGPDEITPDMQKEFEVYLPYKVKLLLNGFKIDEGAPDSVRFDLQFSAEDLLYQKANFRDLMLEHFFEKGTFTRENYLKNTKNFEVALKKLEPFDKDILSYRILPELGGDGIWRSINPPGMDMGDWKSFMSTTGAEMITTTAAYIFGARAGFFRGKPVVSGSLAAGGMRWIHETINELYGKYYLKLPHTKTNMEIAYGNIPEAIWETVGSAVIMKSMEKTMNFFKAADMKMNTKKIIDMARSYEGPSKSVTSIMEKAKNMMVNEYDISAEKAAEYLATSMALQFPDLVIGYTSGVGTKIGVKKMLEKTIKKENIIFDVESQIMKKLVGTDLRLVDEFKFLDDELKILVAGNDASKAYILNAEKTLTEDFIKTLNGVTGSAPNAKYINSFAFPISELAAKLAAAEKATSSAILKIVNSTAAKTNNKYNINFGNQLKADMGEFKRILGLNPDKLIKFLLPDQPLRKNFVKGAVGDKEFKTAMAEFATVSSTIKSMGLTTLKETHLMLKNYLKLGQNQAGVLDYQKANMLLNAVRDLEALATPGVTKNFLRKYKTSLNQSIRTSIGKVDGKLLTLFNKQQNLIYLRQNSGVWEFSKQFGTGTKVLSPSLVAAKYEGSNVFYKFFDGPKAEAHAATLGMLLEKNAYWQTNKLIPFRIRSAAMEFYLDKVIKSGALGTERMTHAQFISKYGKQLESILGPNLWKKFSTNAKSAEYSYKKFVKEFDIDMGIIQKYLGLGNDIEKYTAEAMGSAIMRKGNTLNLAPVIKALGGLNSQGWKAVQRVMVQDMFRKSSTMSPITNELTFNGAMLAEYLHVNQGTLRHAFGNKFITDHKMLAKALIVLQDNTKKTMDLLGKMDPVYKTLAEQTMSGGMVIDIFYGPLNHNRLIMNRLSRLYDGFDLDGVTHSLLSDYNVWVNVAKKNFLSGMYPKILDDMTNLQKTQWAERVLKLHVGFDTFAKPSIVTLATGTEALTEIDLLNEERKIGNYTIQEHRSKPPDGLELTEGLSTAFDMTKEVAEKDIWDPIADFVSNLITNIKSTSENIKKPELIQVEKKLEEMRGQ